MGTRKNKTGTAWAEIGSELPGHPKVRAMSDRWRASAFGFYCAAVAFCQQQRNDGKIYSEQLPAILKCNDAQRVAMVGELVRARLFDAIDDAYMVHDYLEHNYSASEIAARSDVSALNGKKGGIASGKSRGSKGLKQGLEAPRESSADLRAERSEEEVLSGDSAAKRSGAFGPDSVPQGRAAVFDAPGVRYCSPHDDNAPM